MLKEVKKRYMDLAYNNHQEWIKIELCPGNDKDISTSEAIKESVRIDSLRGDLSKLDLFSKDTSKRNFFINKDFRYFDFSGSSFKPSHNVSIKEGLTTLLSNSIFIGCDFSGCDLSYIAAESCDFSGCDFRMSNFSNSILKKCKLRNCNFQRSIMVNTSISDCDLFGSNFSICNIVKSKIFNCVATGASFVNSVLEDCNLKLLRFKHVNLENCYIKNCDVKYSDISNNVIKINDGVK
jgi:uncharacterized protein YjbI with pentapeptide repeats